jgi:hypothetical protein
MVLCDSKLPAVAAVRLQELLSGIYLDELILSGGDGQKVRREAAKFIDRIATLGSITDLTVESALRQWQRIRKVTKRDGNYYPIHIERATRHVPLECPIDLLSPRLTRHRVTVT